MIRNPLNEARLLKLLLGATLDIEFYIITIRLKYEALKVLVLQSGVQVAFPSASDILYCASQFQLILSFCERTYDYVESPSMFCHCSRFILLGFLAIHPMFLIKLFIVNEKFDIFHSIASDENISTCIYPPLKPKPPLKSS